MSNKSVPVEFLVPPVFKRIPALLVAVSWLLIFASSQTFAASHLSEPSSVLIVDAGVQDTQELLSAVAPDVKVVKLHSSSNGVQQIADALKAYRNLDSIQIISHGAPGELALGSAILDDSNINGYRSTLKAWGGALKASGSILLYGCNVAQSNVGNQFINRIAQITGASVAASTDATGSEKLGGNWRLEKRTGAIKVASAISKQAMSGYDHLLALPNGLQDITDTMANGTPTLVSFLPDFTFTNNSGTTLVGDPTVGANGFYINQPTAGTSGGYTVSADGTNMGTFDLTAMSFTNYTNSYNFTVTITGHQLGGGPPVMAYWYLNGQTYSSSGFPLTGLASFDVSIAPNASNPSTIADITFDSFTIANATAPAAAPTAPTATTGAASAISATGATLNGTVNDNGASTTVTFDYGLTTGYGTNVAGGTVAAGAGNTAVAKSLTGLTCNTTYHYRVKAVNAVGTTYGADSSFPTGACVPGAPTIGTATAGDTQATVAFSAPASNGGATITGYTATSSPGGFTGSCASSPCTVTGLTNGIPYTFTVTATNSAGTGAASAASNSVTPNAAQTITFANPGAQNFGTAPTLSATSTSGLTVSFTSSTTSVCTVTSGGALTFVTTGTCTINADQAGDGAYSAAPTVTQSFTVNAVVPGAPTIGTATAGDTQATVAFSAPASNGGATITGYTATSSPGGFTGSCASSPCTVTGLTNGTAYTFTVTATNSAGTSTASAASNSITPIQDGVCGSANAVTTAFMPTTNLCSVGTASSVTAGSPWSWSCSGTGGGQTASCSAPNQSVATNNGPGRVEISGNSWSVDQAQSAGFIATANDPSGKSPPNLPAGYTFPEGLLDFVLTGGTPGTPATITITYPTSIPPSTVYWKYGPSPAGYNCTGAACAAPHWYQMPSSQVAISGNTVTLTITDGGVGDDDLQPNGTIVDQGGPGVPVTGVPVLSYWGRITLFGLLALLGLVALRRRDV